MDTHVQLILLHFTVLSHIPLKLKMFWLGSTGEIDPTESYFRVLVDLVYAFFVVLGI